MKTWLVHTPTHVRKGGKNGDFSDFLEIKRLQMCQFCMKHAKTTTSEPMKLPKIGLMGLSWHNNLSKDPINSAAYLGGGTLLPFNIKINMSSI